MISMEFYSVYQLISIISSFFKFFKGILIMLKLFLDSLSKRI